MFNQMNHQRFAELAEHAPAVTVHKELAGDRLTPINVFQALQSYSDNPTLLESTAKDDNKGRYSHVCIEPLVECRAIGRQVMLTTPSDTQQLEADPFDILRQLQEDYHSTADHPLTRYVGGLIGYLSYDAVRLIETIPDRHASERDGDDLLFRSYKTVISFDHHQQSVVVATRVNTQASDIEQQYTKAIAHLDSLIHIITHYQPKPNVSIPGQDISVTISVDDDAYMAQVERAKQFIREGELFQVVLSRTFSTPCSATGFDIYRALRLCNPSPYQFYIEDGDKVIAGASPEKLVSLSKNQLQSCPLAGTRKRDDGSDLQALSEDLLSDEKELAEHMMLIDLARNDLGRVATPGSVHVTKLKTIEAFKRVIHISSTVEAGLAEDCDVFDALKASFPAGTLSGAPKIRAMEIIDELELSRRGVYGGAICAIDTEGDLETCIVIRTVVLQDGIASVTAGAGIVHDSIPENEAAETYHKAKAVLEAIQLAQGGAL